MNTKVILGKKIAMTQFFLENGELVGVTVIEAGPCQVVQKNGSRVQIGFENKKESRVTKPLKGHFSKAGVGFKRFLREIEFSGNADVNVGDQLDLGQFEVGDKIDIAGISKGKGFAGTIKRFGHRRGPMSHGSGYHRWAGSMGANSKPARVFKGKKLPGHMGAKRVTIQNISILRIEKELNILVIKGCIPGPKNGLLIIKDAVKKKRVAEGVE